MAKTPPSNAHFMDASARQKIPPLGYNDEVSKAINNRDLLSKATDRHHANRKFGMYAKVHEGNHVVFSLLCYTHPELMAGKNYQGDLWSESYLVAMENYIKGAISDKAEFIRIVQMEAKPCIVYENKARVLAWLLAPFSDKTLLEIKVESSLLLSEQMEAEGITLTDYYSGGEKEKVIIITSPQYGKFIISDYGIEFPDDFPGRDIIVPFTVPTNDEAGAMFDALEPAMKLLRDKGKTDPIAPSSVLSDITVMEIVECLRTGVSVNRERNVVRGMDVQPA